MNKDKTILRNLAGQIAEIAALPIQDEKRSLWRKLNSLKPERPMVMIDQVCWNEMNANDTLTLQCENEELRGWELALRKRLYQWMYFPVDSVMEPFVSIKKSVVGMNLGMSNQEHTLATDDTNSVVSHAYVNQFASIEDLEKIKFPVVKHDERETSRRIAIAQEMFDGLLEVRAEGPAAYLSVWDPISMWMGVEGALYSLIDQPELMIALAHKIVDGYMTGLDQLEALNLLEGPQSLIHCTGAWTNELPQEIKSPWTTKDIWMFGLAQMLATVSPAMYEEFEIEISMPLFKRFGLVYYGCCDPLDRKMDQVRRIPNLRKVSMSPWTDKALGASQINGDYVYSYKPNPAYLAEYDETVIRNDLRETMEICKRYNCPVEFILKDISTVKYNPERLWRWAQIAMEEVGR